MRRPTVLFVLAFAVACGGDGAGGVTATPPDEQPPVTGSELALPTLPSPSYKYADSEVPLPPHFHAVIDGVSIASLDNTPADNPITDAGATLGRVLFYDRRLSRNDVTSCASCHRPSIGFADALVVSVGFSGLLTSRHAPGLANARFYRRGRFFWDERARRSRRRCSSPSSIPPRWG